MINTRREKINELKNAIKSAQDNVREHLTNVNVEEESKLSEEERKVKKDERIKEFGVLRANVTALQEELKLTRLNKYGSTFFEYHPHKGMNRRQARAFRKQRR